MLGAVIASKSILGIVRAIAEEFRQFFISEINVTCISFLKQCGVFGNIWSNFLVYLTMCAAALRTIICSLDSLKNNSFQSNPDMADAQSRWQSYDKIGLISSQGNGNWIKFILQRV